MLSNVCKAMQNHPTRVITSRLQGCQDFSAESSQAFKTWRWKRWDYLRGSLRSRLTEAMAVLFLRSAGRMGLARTWRPWRGCGGGGGGPACCCALKAPRCRCARPARSAM